MNRQLKWAALLLVGAVAIVALMIFLRPSPVEQEPVAVAPLVETAAYTVGAGPIEVEASGTVQPLEEVTLGAEVAGRLVYVNPAFREGSLVGSGMTLFRIDPADYQNRVRSAQADVAAQEVAVLQAKEEVTIAEAELRRFAERETGRSALAQAIDGNDYAARILPPQGLPQAGGLRGTTNPNQLATREPQLRSAEAARDRAQAQLADAQLALSRTQVRAPFDGIVRSETTAIGALVQPGQTLGSIVATDAYEVRVSLTEDEAALIPGLFAGSGARIPAAVYTEQSGRRYRWAAYVDRADAILDAETRTIDVFLRVQNPLRSGTPVDTGNGLAQGPVPLLLGSFVQATITGSSSESFARIPINALKTDNQVWVVRDGKLTIVPVEIIRRGDTDAYVRASGLGPSGRVVTSNLRTPVNGMQVRMRPDAEAKADE
ncbi:MAG TPA: HlyD family efflux transporter periplasmic adaptor subunit [Sphingomonadaceae bacterium]|nr:HlyD family efflux transporter periplasmic adaptor subunit [Sphingomonadaceae bacterium]